MNAEREARRRWDSLAKPLGSLGLLEEAGVQIAALTGNADIDLSRRALLVFCADNGVVAQGVTQTDSSVTAAVARALAAGESTVCHMARTANCKVIPVDMGILDFPGAPGVLNRRVRNGTGDITRGPAMSREECVRAIEAGMELVREQKSAGMSILAAGEMGIGNTATSSAVASVLLERPSGELVGRGAGLSNEGLARKRAAVERAISVNYPDPADPVDVLAKVGGLDLAALCGVYLGGSYRVPVLLDGFISAAAALCAEQLAAGVTNLEELAEQLSAREIVIASEIGGGVVPVDPKERAAREAAGRLACLLARRADTVVWVVCGLPQVLKGELPC